MKNKNAKEKSKEINELSRTDELRKAKINTKDKDVSIIPPKIQDPSVDRKNPMGIKLK